MVTIIETETFSRLWPDYWDEANWVSSWRGWYRIRRKVRWRRAGSGKRSGVRVIYYNRLASGVIYLLLI